MSLFKRKKKKQMEISAPQKVATSNPMSDFFNTFAKALMENERAPIDSKHGMYLAEISVHPQMMKDLEVNSARDLNVLVREKFEDLAVTRLKYRRRYEVSIRHPYIQDYDIRLYQTSVTERGWCLGISAYWLRHKIIGHDIFPLDIYTNRELKSRSGAPIQLMLNQMKILKQMHLLEGNTPIDPVFLNVLRYATEGNFNPACQVFDAKQPMKVPMGRYTEMVKRNMEQSSRSKRRLHDKHMYVIGLWFNSGGGHAMALDMTDGEFFDSNQGVFYHRNHPLFLLKFVFEVYIPKYYGGGHGLASLAVYRC